jgi:hypothetical protein
LVKCANYGRDGLPLTSREAFFNFFSRALSNQVNYGVLQADSRLDIQFNVDLFMKSLSYVDDDGTRRTAAPWVFAPGWRPKDASKELGQRGEVVDELESTSEFRENGLKELLKHELYTAQFIPHCVANDDKVTALTEDDVQSLVACPQMSYPRLSVQARLADGIPVTMSLPSKIRRRPKDKQAIEECDDDEEQEEREDRGPLASRFHDLVNTRLNAETLRAKEAKEKEKENRKRLKKSQKEQEKRGKEQAKGRKGEKRKASESVESEKQKRRCTMEIESQGVHNLAFFRSTAN